MPYLHHTQEFIDKTTEVWINFINRYNPDTNKKYTQKQVIDYINEKYGEVSIKTIREWIVGKGLNRGQSIGQERGEYLPQRDCPQRARKTKNTQKYTDEELKQHRKERDKIRYLKNKNPKN